MLLYFEMNSMKYVLLCQGFHMKYNSTFHAAERLCHNLNRSAAVFLKLFILALKNTTYVAQLSAFVFLYIFS